MSFKLNYICNDCDFAFVARTTDGKVHPPPDYCENCSATAALLRPKKKRRQPGDIINGFLLVSYARTQHVWKVQCLFCLEYDLVGRTNITRQKSCGCIKSGTLLVNSFNNAKHTCECECRECGLTSTYSLTTGEQITCKGGC